MANLFFIEEVQKLINKKKVNNKLYTKDKYDEIVKILKHQEVVPTTKSKDYYWAKQKFQLISVGNLEQITLKPVSTNSCPKCENCVLNLLDYNHR